MKKSVLMIVMGAAVLVGCGSLISCGTKKAGSSDGETVNAVQGADAQDANAEYTNPMALTDGQWRLTDFAGTDSIVTVPADKDYVLFFNSDDSRFGINTDCNSIAGNYKATADSIKFYDVAVTMMMCPDMTVENGMKDALTKADTYYISADSVLTLRGDMRKLARFKFVK